MVVMLSLCMSATSVSREQSFIPLTSLRNEPFFKPRLKSYIMNTSTHIFISRQKVILKPLPRYSLWRMKHFRKQSGFLTGGFVTQTGGATGLEITTPTPPLQQHYSIIIQAKRAAFFPFLFNHDCFFHAEEGEGHAVVFIYIIIAFWKIMIHHYVVKGDIKGASKKCTKLTGVFSPKSWLRRQNI